MDLDAVLGFLRVYSGVLIGFEEVLQDRKCPKTPLRTPLNSSGPLKTPLKLLRTLEHPLKLLKTHHDS